MVTVSVHVLEQIAIFKLETAGCFRRLFEHFTHGCDE